MSANQFASPALSTGSSIPLGAEAMRYNASHHLRPSSSRNLFGSHRVKSRDQSEVSPVVGDLLVDDANPFENGCDAEVNVDAKTIITSDRLIFQMEDMFSKLTQDMDRVCSVYGDGSFFSQSPLSFEAELNELKRLSEENAREQLERYALRCHVSEREKEQLHKRNHELSNALEIMRTQVIRGQRNFVEQVQALAKQALDALRSLEQSSSAEIVKWRQKHALLLAQNNTFQNQLRHGAAQLEAKTEEAYEANKNLDMLRFERDSLRNHNEQIAQQLNQAESGIRELEAAMRMKDEALQAKEAEITAKSAEICDLNERLRQAEGAADLRMKRREEEIKRQMDNYLQETKLIDAERERIARLKIAEMQHELKLAEEGRLSAERRARIAEQKVVDYEENFIKYRGQMEGEALRAITNGYRNALSAIPSARRDHSSSVESLRLMLRPSYSENVEPPPPADPCGMPASARNIRLKMSSKQESVMKSDSRRKK